MKKVFLALTLLMTFCLGASPNATSNDEQAAKRVVSRFWTSSRTINWKNMESGLEFPVTVMPVGVSHAGKPVTYRDKVEFEKTFQNIKSHMRRGLKLEIKQSQLNARVSHLEAQIKNHTSAYVTYTYQPEGDKTPYELMTILHKGKRGWKIVFSTVPW